MSEPPKPADLEQDLLPTFIISVGTQVVLKSPKRVPLPHPAIWQC
jgi:hypothetical protein